jgi:hypothetical protein
VDCAGVGDGLLAKAAFPNARDLESFRLYLYQGGQSLLGPWLLGSDRVTALMCPTCMQDAASPRKLGARYGDLSNPSFEWLLGSTAPSPSNASKAVQSRDSDGTSKESAENYRSKPFLTNQNRNILFLSDRDNNMRNLS